MSKVIVFIDGPFPTEDDLKLAQEHGTKCFRNAQHGAGTEPHDLAVATDPSLIPEGYTVAKKAADKAPAPNRNPSAPPKLPVPGSPLAPAMD